MGEDAGITKLSPSERSDTSMHFDAARLDEITHKLLKLDGTIAGPKVRELVDLVAETVALWDKPCPPVHPSLYASMPEEAWISMIEHEQRSRTALKSIIKMAKKTEALIEAPVKLAERDADPFGGAVHSLSGYPFTAEGSRNVEQIIHAIRVLAAVPTLLDSSEKRGQRPLAGLAGPVVRASCYYRTKYELPLTIDFVYLDRSGERVGKRSLANELAPNSATAILACDVLAAFDIPADPASVQTHLRNFKALLEREDRNPFLSDFHYDFG